MTITKTVRATVSRALREKGLTHSELSEAIGVTPGWVTKFFNGKLLSLTEDRITKIEKALDIKFQRLIPSVGGNFTEIEKLGELMKERPELVDIVGGLLKLAEKDAPAVIHELPHFETKELTKLGAEFTRIVYAWEIPADPHYTKIGLEIVRFISNYCAKRGD